MNKADTTELTRYWHHETNYLNIKIDDAFKEAQDHAYALGLLTDGRMFAIESKRRSWTKPSGEREEEQHNFILTVQNAGGVGGFVTSAEQALEILNK